VFTRSNLTDRARQALVLGCLSVSIAFPALAQQDAGLTDLGGVVRQALSENPDVAEARNQWFARREEVRQAEGGYYPTIDLNAGIGVEHTDSPGTRARYGGSNELTRKELGLSLRQMLFDGWGTRSEVSRQQARADSAAARLVVVGESTAMRTTEAYVDLERYQALYGISADSVAVHRRIQDQIRLRSDAGVGRRADLDQVNSRVALAEVNLVAADVNLMDVRTTFQRVVGVPPSTAYAPTPDPAAALAGSLAESLEIAQANNPVLQVAAADIEAARAQHEAARQFDYPRLDLEIGGNLDNDIDGIEGRVDDLSAMLRLRYNLYRGGSDAARKRATALNVNEAMDIRDRSVRQLEESVRLAWAALQATSAQLPLLRRQVDAAIATRDAYAKQFNIGQRTLLDLLNAENEVSQARQSVVNAAADRLLAQYRLLEAKGQLVDHLDVADAVVRDPADG
jgi:outer membrane protein, adhesin transport system